MCTRYYIDMETPELKDILAAAKTSLLSNKFISAGHPVITAGEIRPTNVVPVIAPNPRGIRTVYPMKWGFTNPNHGSTLFNARSETAGQKPTFMDAWKSHRCIIPASYYFEWDHFKDPTGKTKAGNKYAIQPVNLSVTWLCGLYRIENGLPAFVILTREPSDMLRGIHDRMPLILPSDKIADWIRPDADPDTILQYALTDMAAEKAKELCINNSVVSGHNCIVPIWMKFIPDYVYGCQFLI